MRYLLIALLGAGAYTYTQLAGLTELAVLSKGIPVLVLLCWLRLAPADSYRRWLSLGLWFSLAGDILLAWPQDLFVFGLGAFLLGHLAYLKAYLCDSRQPAWVALLLAGVTGLAMFNLLAQANLGALMLPVAGYAMAISAMLWRALARFGQQTISPRSQWLAAIGAALFVASDSMIGIDRFVIAFDGADAAIMTTYWLGQWGITASAFNRQRSS